MNTSNALDPQSPLARAIYDLGIVSGIIFALIFVIVTGGIVYAILRFRGRAGEIDPKLTFVTAGGGFSGTETTGAVNDFVPETLRYYPQLREELIRVVMVHPGNFILPELGEELGRYAEHKLRERKVDVIKGPRVANYDGVGVTLSDGTSPCVILKHSAVNWSESAREQSKQGRRERPLYSPIQVTISQNETS